MDPWCEHEFQNTPVVTAIRWERTLVNFIACPVQNRQLVENHPSIYEAFILFRGFRTLESAGPGSAICLQYVSDANKRIGQNCQITSHLHLCGKGAQNRHYLHHEKFKLSIIVRLAIGMLYAHNTFPCPMRHVPVGVGNNQNKNWSLLQRSYHSIVSAIKYRPLL